MPRNNPTILLVEDEASLAMLVKDNLLAQGYEVYHAENGDQALERFYFVKPDIVLLDVMMPKLNGYKVAETIRNTDKETPILFITAKVQTKDVIKGFESGGNDYIRKPFSIEELLVRIKVMLSDKRLLEKQKVSEIEQFQIGEYTFNSKKRLLFFKGEMKKLTGRETELLKLFCSNENQLLSKKSLLQNLWGDDSFFNSRSLDVFVSRLRKYLKEDPSLAIVNVRGQGYKFLIYNS